MPSNVIAQVVGGSKRVLDNVSTVGDVLRDMNAEGYTATVNGEPAGPSTPVRSGDFVSMAKNQKGGH